MDNTIELKKEKERSQETLSIVKTALTNLENSLESMGSENLQRLRDLRDSAEANPDDLLQFINHLQAKNQVFNFKDKFARVEELKYLQAEPYFARIDIRDQSTQEKSKLYLGKFGLSLDKPVVIDWRAKIASIYYRYRYPQQNVAYDTPEGKQVRDLELKRTFEFDEGTLLKFYNNDLQIDENELIGEKIAQRTGGVLQDIVATIQENQLDIIEADPRQICVVQGCVGSGKSTVAIHKLSHIFFNFPNFIRAERSILIAKNQILVGYLSTLFPKLGIFDINYGTLKDQIIKLVFGHELKVDLDLSNEIGLAEFDTNEVALLKKDVEEAKNYARNELESLANTDAYSSLFSYVYDKALSISENVTASIADLTEEYMIQKEALSEGLDERRELVAKDNIKNIKQIISRLRKIATHTKGPLFNQLLRDCKINTSTTMNYRDAIIYLYLYAEFIGFANFRSYEYCVIDEAQDFSLLEYLLLNKLVLNGRFCILGDLNQSYQKEGLKEWEEINQIVDETKNCKKFELTTNYRSTKPIIEFASNILKDYTKHYLPNSINRKGPLVEEFSCTNFNEAKEKLFSHLNKDLLNLEKSIGVICFDDSEIENLAQDIQTKYVSENLSTDKIIVLNERERVFFAPKGLYITSFKNCKGLEFAKVYVLGMHRKPKDFLEAKKNYVACTRAMNELFVYYIENEI